MVVVIILLKKPLIPKDEGLFVSSSDWGQICAVFDFSRLQALCVNFDHPDILTGEIVVFCPFLASFCIFDHLLNNLTWSHFIIPNSGRSLALSTMFPHLLRTLVRSEVRRLFLLLFWLNMLAKK